MFFYKMMFKYNYTLCGCRNVKYFKSFTTQAEANQQILSDLMGVTRNEVNAFVINNKLENKDGELLAQGINFCKQLGYTSTEILQTPSLLTRHPLEVEQQYHSLKEGGFTDIRPQILGKARTYMKRIVRYLKSIKLIHSSTDVAQNFILCIEDKNITENISITKTDEDLWNNIHLEILKAFLRFRLQGTEDEIDNLLEVHFGIKNKSFKVIQENIKIAEDLGFEPRKMIKYGYLLSNYPLYPQTTLKDLNNLAGIDMKHAMRLYPKLVTASPKNILKTYGILKEFDISDELIRNQPNIFTLSSETVRVRLQEIERSQDLKVLLTNPKVLSLIIHNNRAKTRLTYLQQLQLRCTSLSILKTNFNDKFEEYLKEGKDVNKSVDLLNYLQKLFSIPVKELRLKIRRHPYHLYVPLKDMQETYNYLVAKRFSNDNIYKVVYILLYPRAKVQNAHAVIKYDKSYKYTSLSQVNKLNLMIYLIEKEHHFTGNGIWKTSKPHQSREIVEQ